MTAVRSDRPPATARRRSTVLHVLPDLRIGGGQTIVLNHLRYRDRERFDVHVCHLLPGDDLRSAFVDAGVVPVHLPHRSTLSSVSRIARHARRVGADVLHVHSDLDRKLAQLAALAVGKPVIGHLHAEWVHFGPQLPPRANRIRRVRAGALAALRDSVEHRVVTHYIAESREVQRVFTPLVDKPVSVLQQSISPEHFGPHGSEERLAGLRRELRLSPGTRVALNVSRLVPGKGHLQLLHVLAQLRSAGLPVTLVLVGDGEMRQELQCRADDAGLGDHVRFLGSRLDVPDLLALADVFVFGSTSEGFGLAVLEAMAARCPVVAFRIPALEEFVTDGESGLLVPMNDVDQFAAAVANVLVDRETAVAMGRAGRAVVEERFHSSLLASSIESVYDQVLAARRQGSRK